MFSLRGWSDFSEMERESHSARAAFILACAACLFLIALVAGRPTPLPYQAPASPPPWTHEPIMPVPEVPKLDRRKVAMGRDLFNDPRLSGRGDMPCARCHDIQSNGTTNQSFGLKTNTPTVFNAALSSRLGWSGHDRTLEDQALATLQSGIISKGVPFSVILERLRMDRNLDARFIEIFGRRADARAVAEALAAYERTLVTPGSRFDRWLWGDNRALGDREVRGYKSFKKLGCAACHQGQNVGGNMFQKNGIFRPVGPQKPRILRVPSLRNVAETPPYFHDGSAPTLLAAVRRMAVAQLDIDISPDEAMDIVHFLRSLTGSYEGAPVRAAQ